MQKTDIGGIQFFFQYLIIFFESITQLFHHIAGTADGSRPGIFYVPILDATKFNVTSGMQSLFLHEAIPGHHYQISLQQ